MSRRDLVHVLEVLARSSSGEAGVGVPVAEIDEGVGRGYRDMRTPLNLESLRERGFAVQLREDAWALTPEGIAWLKQDRELSDR